MNTGFVLNLTGTGSETSIDLSLPFSLGCNWQLQSRTGVPLGNLDHYGRMRGKGKTILLPVIPSGQQYQLVLVARQL